MEVSLYHEKFDFTKNEADVLAYWKEINAFELSNKLSEDRPKYTFLDGPPFATGLPHYGHILAGTIKDTVTRWAYQTGHHVERRFGWDCHGLPVEYEIDKRFDIKGPEDVAKMGIAVYNNHCRNIVMRYSEQWEEVVERMGRWINFRHDYKTMYPWFMESVWFIFKQFYDKDFVYRSFKVMPYSMGCCTSLSNFEASQNYKDTVDPSIWISFELTDDPTIKLLVWTTTPWTLPSNLALCVNPNSIYVKILDKTKNEIFILMKKRLVVLYKQSDDYQILDTFKGSSLKDMKYTPLFPYFTHINTAFRILCDDYISENDGTGIVHQAPYFGEDDYRICLANNIINKDTGPIVCPIDVQCRFTNEIKDFQGQNVKDADESIIKYLRANKKLFHQSTIKHSYPFCSRSNTPLIYRAIPSWFIRIENIIDRLLTNNNKTYWIPDYVKEKRFSNWLSEARDWAISRNRYWGNPIPLWISDDEEEIICIGSIEELKQLSGISVDDLHREFIDHIKIPSRLGKGYLHRIPEVFDCWFESGSMPYAQVHYPFDKKDIFMETFPADFIAEGLDQTRGWFYTLLVISTVLFDQPPFKNLIVNGIILSKGGEKLAKNKKKFRNPIEIFDKYGADALRLYLMKSSAVRGESMKFQADDVCNIVKNVFIPLYNSLRLLIQSCEQLKIDENIIFIFDNQCLYSSNNNNMMDIWILSYTQTLVDFIQQEMNAYRLDTAACRFIEYIDALTNWYIKWNKKRFKGETTLNDRINSLNVFYYILLILTKLMAPFTPFLTEYMFQMLKKLMPLSSLKQDLSVHFQMIPKLEKVLVNKNIEYAVIIGQKVIEFSRTLRDRKQIPLRYPLTELVIFHNDTSILENIELVKDFIREGVNVRNVTSSQDRRFYGIQMCVEPNFRTLGRKAGVKRQSITEQIRQMSDIDIENLLANNENQSPLMIIDDIPIELEDIHIVYRVANQTRFETIVEQGFIILLDCIIDAAARDDGHVREITNRVQRLRREARLTPNDNIVIYYSIEPQTSDIARVAIERQNEIEANLGKPFVQWNDSISYKNNDVIITTTLPIVDSQVKFIIIRNK